MPTIAIYIPDKLYKKLQNINNKSKFCAEALEQKFLDNQVVKITEVKNGKGDTDHVSVKVRTDLI